MNRTGKSRAQIIAMQATVSELLDRKGEATILMVCSTGTVIVRHTIKDGLAYAEEVQDKK